MKFKKPNFSFEKSLWKRGFKIVAGLDEAGRGSFAGPIVCGCVIFNKKINAKTQMLNVRINDSKKLTELQRQRAYQWIKKNALAYGIGVAETSEINRRGLAKSSASAFRRAVSDTNSRSLSRIEYLLIDAFFIPYIREIRMPLKRHRRGMKTRHSPKILDSRSRQLAIVNGDEKSLSIAAASIIAKVYRDRLMIRLGKQSKYKQYGWDKNKGYGTLKHRKAIKKFGITKHHRKQFIH